MKDILRPIKPEALPDMFVSRFEQLILSGQLKIGQTLPSERELALKLGVSRPVVHEGLVDLAFKGLVSIRPRVGTVVNDYRKHGSITLLTSLLNFKNGKLDPELLVDVLEVRKLIENETARLAPENKTAAQLDELKEIYDLEVAAIGQAPEKIADLDFSFHHQLAICSGNFIYPLLLNSFKDFYTNLSAIFFSDEPVIRPVLDMHLQLIDKIETNDGQSAAIVMDQLLNQGAARLWQIMDKTQKEVER